jgi:conjugal transfer/entry exclusion protein
VERVLLIISSLPFGGPRVFVIPSTLRNIVNEQSGAHNNLEAMSGTVSRTLDESYDARENSSEEGQSASLTNNDN